MGTLRMILTLTLLSACFASAADNPARDPSSLPTSAQARISASLGKDRPEYFVHPVSGGFKADSRGLASRFTQTGVEVNSGSARWGLALRGYGYRRALHSVARVAPQAAKNRVEYRRGAMTEWYVNGPMGLEQGFTVAERPGKRNGQPLTIVLDTSGNLTTTADDGGRDLELTSADGRAALRYAGLTAYDASGKELTAYVRVHGEQLLLQVDDRHAQYPVIVDPVVQLAKFSASDGKPADEMGVSVGISGNVVVAGTFANAAYVFVKPPTGWQDMTQTAKLTPSDGGGLFGVTVAISGSVVVVGAPGANQNQGAAYVFLKPRGGWRDMKENAKLVASDGAPGDTFGSVSVSGDTVVVGAQAATINGNQFEGAAYVFVSPNMVSTNAERPILTETAKLTASDGKGGDRFGGAVSISGDTIAVGAQTASSGAGAAYVFVKPPTGWVTTTETAKLSPSDAGGFLGGSIATNGSTVAAGAMAAHENGAVYVYVAVDGRWANMSETAQLVAVKRGWSFSQSVTVDAGAKAIAVGAPQGNGRQNGAGDVFIFVEPPGGWQNTSRYRYRVFASDGQDGETFGVAVSISGKVLVVGASAARIGNNAAQGAAYLFGAQ
ncbi:MAG: FG-GAP repeat protein [Acidobacteriia bacterium]|nr:FG-GAP repeat protein [Terriglobia bacterium]